jgi:hypothetical protein
MARINIDDSIYKDARFMDLVMLLGSSRTALGALVQAWSVAQDWYLTPERMIPFSVWEKQKLAPEILTVGLAERVGEKIRLLGAEKQFSWLSQCSQAGKLGNAARRMKSLNNSPNVVNRPVTGRGPLTLSLTLKNKEERVETTKKSSPPLFELWNQNCGALPKAISCSGRREKHAVARWREYPDREYWLKVIQTLTVSEFCLGVNNRGWRADFDFFIKPGASVSIMEGKYDNARSRSPNATMNLVPISIEELTS